MAKVADAGTIRTDSGDITNEPSDDDAISYVSTEDLAAHSRFPFLDSGWDENRNGDRADFSGNRSTPKRAGSPPDAPSSQRRRVPG